MMLQFYNSLSVHYMQIHEPTELERDDAVLFAHNVRKAVCVEMLGRHVYNVYNHLFGHVYNNMRGDYGRPMFVGLKV